MKDARPQSEVFGSDPSDYVQTSGTAEDEQGLPYMRRKGRIEGAMLPH